jgi:hypothetical protein
VTPVGMAFTGSGESTLLPYTDPGYTLRVEITSSGHMQGVGIGLNRAPSYDDSSMRPSSIPSTHVAYASALIVMNSGHTYTGELQYLNDLVMGWQRYDDLDPWDGGNSVQLIGNY